MSVPIEMMQEELEPVADNVRPPMDASDVISAVTREIEYASDWYGNDTDTEIERAWRYFRGELPGVLDEDISEYFQGVVSHDVADAIEATIAEIMPAFGTDSPATFDSVGAGDEDAAAMESDICTDILMESGAGFLQVTTAVKNALLLRTGFLEIIWDDRKDVRYHEESNVTPEVIWMLQQHPNLEVLQIEGAPGAGQTSGNMRVQVRETIEGGKVHVEAVPVDEMLISSDAESLDLDEARMSGRQTLLSRSDLIATGYDEDTVLNLRSYTTSSTSARYSRERSYSVANKQSGDESTELVLIARLYYRLDEDRDGIAERRYIVVGGGPGHWELLEDRPIEYQGFCAGAAYIWPHSPRGISLVDRLSQVQDLRTKHWRTQLEAGTRSARDRVGLPPGVDEDDWNTSMFGGGVRFTSNPPVPIPNPTYPSELAQLDDMATRARREGGGGAVDKANQEAMPVEAGAHSVERMLSAIEEQNAMAARTIAETLIHQAYRKIHIVLRLYSPPITRVVNGEEMQVDPSQWRQRDKISTAVGLTMSERGRLTGGLGMLVQRQIEAMEKGMVIASEDTLHSTLISQARMLGLKNPESYLVDPKSKEGQQAAQARAEQQQQAQAAQQQASEQQQQLLLQIEAMRAETAQNREQMKFMVEQMKLTGKIDVEAAKIFEDARQANQDAKLEATELELKYGTNVPGSAV